MITAKLIKGAIQAVKELYGQDIGAEALQVQKTRKEFEGDLTLVVFPFTRFSKKSPEATASEMGERLLKIVPEFTKYAVVKGFLNLVVDDRYWLQFLADRQDEETYGNAASKNDRPILIEFSSPNTNKPLHLGHIRNNLLGWSLSRILEAAGHRVMRVNLVNDRGIHICKSMLAWQRWGKGENPESSGKKGDHLVGDYYVLFDQHYREQIKQLKESGLSDDEAAKQAPLMLEVQAMLRQWEAGDEDVHRLWQMMNSWVYTGFEETYARLGIRFDKTYYESATYLRGKDIVQSGLAAKLLIQKEDSSVWADLTNDGLDEKLLLRSDGTSVYITQDLGTAKLRHDEFDPKQMIYVVGNEQNYHFDVLKKVLQKLGFDWSSKIHHMSYGMVELPEGKMKSREGTVVDADDLMDEMQATARRMTEELGKSEGLDPVEAETLYRTIGLGALKYFILKVDPEKNMVFNPEESIDFDGNTGPFIQYTHARICSLLKKAGAIDGGHPLTELTNLYEEEREVLILCHDYPGMIQKSAIELSPAHIANYIYDLTRAYNTFYQKVPVLKEPDDSLRQFRIRLSDLVRRIIRNALDVLGIEAPERM